MIDTHPPRARAPAELLPQGLLADEIELLCRIAGVLDGTHWNADTLERISRYLRDAGFDIREPREDGTA